MRFPRQARIFRGQIDTVPVVGVFFLLLIFLILKSSLTYKPGLPVGLVRPSTDAGESSGAHVIRINARGHLLYGTEIFQEEDALVRVARLKERLRSDLPKADRVPVVIRAEPAVGNELIARVKDALSDLNLETDIRGMRIEMPESEPLPGLTEPSLVVSVDLTGRLYFENQAVPPEELAARLKEAVTKAPQPLTLVVQADRYADYGSVIEVISRLAVTAGIKQFWLSTQPGSLNGIRRPAGKGE